MECGWWHSYYTSLRPITVWKDTSIKEFLDVAGYGRQCDLSPCPLFQDGDLALYGNRLRLYDADYVVIMQLEDAENARVVIYDPTIDELLVLARTPTTFEDHVRQTSIQQGILRAEDYALEAWRFSWAMTVNAKKIFKLRRMILTQGQDLMVFPCRHGPAGFSLVKHAAFRDPFGLLFALKEVLLVEDEVPWKLMEVHPSVMAASISRHGKVMGILEEDGRDSLNDVFVLLQRTLRPKGSQEETYHNYMSLWTGKFFELHDFLRQQGMFALYARFMSAQCMLMEIMLALWSTSTWMMELSFKWRSNFGLKQFKVRPRKGWMILNSKEMNLNLISSVLDLDRTQEKNRMKENCQVIILQLALR